MLDVCGLALKPLKIENISHLSCDISYNRIQKQINTIYISLPVVFNHGIM